MKTFFVTILLMALVSFQVQAASVTTTDGAPVTSGGQTVTTNDAPEIPVSAERSQEAVSVFVISAAALSGSLLAPIVAAALLSR